jgi:hypothetical protein
MDDTAGDRDLPRGIGLFDARYRQGLRIGRLDERPAPRIQRYALKKFFDHDRRRAKSLKRKANLERERKSSRLHLLHRSSHESVILFLAGRRKNVVICRELVSKLAVL